MIGPLRNPMKETSQLERLISCSPRKAWRWFCRRVLKMRGLPDFDDQHPCIFVPSTGRAGTQTVAALFGLARNVFAYHEPLPTLSSLPRFVYLDSFDPAMQPLWRHVFLATRDEFLRYSLACRKGYVETNNHMAFLAPIISECVSEVSFVHLVRNPADFAKSAVRYGWYVNNPDAPVRIVPREGSQAAERWTSYSPFQKNLWLWNETNSWIQSFLSRLSTNRKLLVKSEAIFAAEEETLRRLFAFAGAELPRRKELLSVLGKKLNAKPSGTFPEPSDWTDTMWAETKRIAGKTAATLGYVLE